MEHAHAPNTQSGNFSYYAGPVYWSNNPGYEACAWGASEDGGSSQICGYQ